MPLSKLQQYILEECHERGGQCQRRVFDNAANSRLSQALTENYKKIVTVSIERLIDRGLVIGYGTKTKEKLFIDKIKLTAGGKREILKLRELKQAKLPYVSRQHKKISGPAGTLA